MSAPENAAPTPWVATESHPDVWYIDEVWNKSLGFIAVCYSSGIPGSAEANATLIVRAVNNHAALVATLRDLLDNPNDTAAQVRAATVLAKAEDSVP